MADTAIEWTDTTWNPVVGCQRVSEGCRHCYAERLAHRGMTAAHRGLTVLGADGPRWIGEVRFLPDRLAAPLGWRKPRRVFVNSMSDLFHDGVTNEQIAAVFGVMAAAPRHTFQVLTKRPARMVEWFRWVGSPPQITGHMHGRRGVLGECLAGFDAALADRAWSEMAAARVAAEGQPTSIGDACAWPWPLPNVWIGVTAENQAAADERIPLLLAAPAAVRFVSVEPMIGPVNLTLHGSRIKGWDEDWRYDTLRGAEWGGIWRDEEDPPARSTKLDWVIAGGESGPGARPCPSEWLRALRDEVVGAGVAFFLKQSRPAVGVTAGPGSARARGVIELPYLDGVQHAAFPAVAA